MTAFQSYANAVAALAKAKRPLFVLLKDIDADAIGSLTALALSLQAAGARPLLVSRGAIPDGLAFVVPASLSFETVSGPFAMTDFDAVVTGDAGSIARTGFVEEFTEARSRGIPLVNIDHHHVHEPFGTHNVIDEHASSTAELVYDLIKLGGWPLGADGATALLTGITADTDAFTNAGTTVRSLEIAAHCYAKGADRRRIMQELYQGKELNALRLWGAILARLVKNEQYGIVATVIRQDDFAAYDLSDEATEGIANFMNTIADMKAALILKELPDGLIRGSMRTTRDDVDVSALAKLFGGGGHKKAAGFTIQGHIVETPTGWQITP